MKVNNWTKVKYDVPNEINDSRVFPGLKILVSLMMIEWTM